MKNKIIIIAAMLIASIGTSCKKNIDYTFQEQKTNYYSQQTVHSEIIIHELKLTGKIVPDEARQASVYALVSGRISDLKVELGDYVRHGQALAVLKSAEVASANNDLALAKFNLEIARKNQDAFKEMYESDLVPERDFITAKVEYEKAVSELQKAENIVSITGREILAAPISGYIIAKNINNNSEVRSDMSEPLFSIADLSTVWALVDVFEVDINRIELGQVVEVHTLSSTDKKYVGKIDKIYNVLDPDTKTMKVRVSLANSGNELMPGMFVSVVLKASLMRSAVLIPSKSLVFSDNKLFVVVVNKNNEYEIRQVFEVFRNDEKCYVDGLFDGENIVVKDQLFLFEKLN